MEMTSTRRTFLAGVAALAAWPRNLWGADALNMPPRRLAVWETPDGNATDRVMARRLYLDLAGRIPTAAEALEGASLRYVLHAFGDGETANTIDVSMYGDSAECSFGIYLKVNPHSLITGGCADISEYSLPDGTTATIAAFRAQSDGEPCVIAFYVIDDVMYRLSLDGGSKKQLLAEAKAILDTVE
jgi:hypothetical protein